MVEIEKEKYVDYLKNEVIYLGNDKVIEEIMKKVTNIFNVLDDKSSFLQHIYAKKCNNEIDIIIKQNSNLRHVVNYKK